MKLRLLVKNTGKFTKEYLPPDEFGLKPEVFYKPVQDRFIQQWIPNTEFGGGFWKTIDIVEIE